jgi:hypothetical protein
MVQPESEQTPRLPSPTTPREKKKAPEAPGSNRSTNFVIIAGGKERVPVDKAPHRRAVLGTRAHRTRERD